jgi:C1A family cysteine protease
MMRSVLVALLFVVAVAFAAQVYENGAVEITEDPKSLFLDFMQTHNKHYKSVSETAAKFENFKATIARVNKLNAQSRNAHFGITKFADLSPEEFSTTILMKNKIQPKEDTEVVQPADVAVPSTFDWRDKGAVTPVKDQEDCGSCWAFSATEAVESAWILAGKATNTSIDLGPQQIVDCDTTSDGCDGGETESAYTYLIGAGGQESNVSYPYHGVDGQCQFNDKLVVAEINSYKAATSFYSETTLQSNLVAWGPLSVCVDAASWQDYQNGVLTHFECAFFNVLDHCVQLVGYNATAPTPYWIVRNSWTHVWGVDGYIFLEMWHDTCGIAHDATWPVVSN